MSENQCSSDLKKHQQLREKVRPPLETITLDNSINKEHVKSGKDLPLYKSNNESTCNDFEDTGWGEKCQALTRENRKSAPAKLMSVRKSKRKHNKSCCKENSKGCRKKLETHKIYADSPNSSNINTLETGKQMWQISTDEKNNCEGHANHRSIHKNYEVQTDRNTKEEDVNNKVTVDFLQPASVKKRKRKLLPLESSICISSQLDSTIDESLCFPYYEMTPCKDTRDVASKNAISEDNNLLDKERLEINSFLRKESCAFFIVNKSKKHDFCQRLMSTIVCTSMSRK